jgi:hypothetical protein
MIDRWTEYKKTFRFIKRYRFSHSELPVSIDLSIVKTNRKRGNVSIPTFTLQQSFVLENPDSYEIEIELNNDRIKSSKLSRDTILSSLRKVTHYILCGLQGTNYPISYREQDHVLKSYLNLIYSEKTAPYDGIEVRSSDFFGPSSVTLQVEQLLSVTKDNVLTNYSVTDKADGDRKMLYICPHVENGSAHLYLIDMNMNVSFTGKTTLNKELYNTLVDGEHILYDKTGVFINHYMAFDIYFTNEKKEDNNTVKTELVSVRKYPFVKAKNSINVSTIISTNEVVAESSRKKYRYSLLKERIKELNLNLLSGNSCHFIVNVKDFYSEESIFDSCSKVLNSSAYLLYNTDGLIFTPCHLSIPIHPAKNKFKVTWEQSFKWKPAHYNTIDFFVKTLRDKTGQEIMKTNFQGGQDLSDIDVDSPYKIIELRCGVDKNNPRHKNPFNEVLNLLTKKSEDMVKRGENNEDSYTAERFQPTDPFDPFAYICYIELQRDHAN